MILKRTQNLIVGGALMGALFFFAGTVSGYDQHNTHPALTDEIVDLFNLNFVELKLSNEDKEWIVQGSVDEDTGVRPLNHFYDPVHNKGIAGGNSSKEWAVSPGEQRAWAEIDRPVIISQSMVEDTESPNGVFTWQRAIEDYVVGNRKRAMLGIGHILHLLEDASVPDHT